MTRGAPEPMPTAGPVPEPVPGRVSETVRRLPAPALRPFVAWYTGYLQAGAAPARHRGLPSPVLTMIVALDDPLVIAVHPDPRQPASQHDVLLGGLHTSPALITHDGRQSGIQLGLTPLGARALLGMPAGELVSIDVDGEDVLGRFAAELRERVRDADTWQARFAVLDDLLARRAEHDASMRPEVGYVWHRLLAADGAVPISELAARTGWSARHLTGQFRAETGLPPKAAARVILRADMLTVHTRWRQRLKGGDTAVQQERDQRTQAATRIRNAETVLIPGLLQTARYARSIIAQASGLYGITDTDAAVQARMQRQHVLYDTSKTFEFVTTEAALRLLPCPPQVMLGQLDRLLSLGMDHVLLGIIPFGIELPIAPYNSFLLLDDDLTVETLTGRDEENAGDEAAMYHRIFDMLIGEACTGDEARRLVMSAAEQLRGSK